MPRGYSTKMNYTDAQEEQLIMAVSEHPELYDTNHEDYRNVLKKEFLWKCIAEELNRDSQNCKKKWKLLRDGYHRFQKTNKLRGSGHVNSKIQRHQQLMFLDNIAPKTYSQKQEQLQEKMKMEENSFTNDGNDEQDLTSDHSIPQSEHMIKTETDDVDPDDNEDDYNEDDYNEDDSDDSDDEFLSNKVEVTTKKLRLSGETSLSAQETEEPRQKLFKRIAKQKNDDVDLFCSHIAEVLRKLPPVLRAEAKKQLGVLISDYEIMAAREEAGTSAME